MEPIITLILIYTVTTFGSIICITLVSKHISEKIEQTISKYRPSEIQNN